MEKFKTEGGIEVWSWNEEVEDGAKNQALDLSKLPFLVHHVALMPDCHQGYGMPIGGVITCQNVVIPNAVGVDIGCGMCAVQTNYPAEKITKDQIIAIREIVKNMIPVGEGNVHDKELEEWSGFDKFLSKFKNPIQEIGWYKPSDWSWFKRSLGTLGGGNHFIEIQSGDDGNIWLMLHSGSRNLGSKIANYYNELALKWNKKWYSNIPNDDLAFLPTDIKEGGQYLRDMGLALRFAEENRKRMMILFKAAVVYTLGEVIFTKEINIHHNYANLEHHFGKDVWVHRKGATSAREGQVGIIPGSQGTNSYIVEGLGNVLSFQSCSHGAGRKMGRMNASRTLSVDECTKSMEGIVYDGWKEVKRKAKKDPDGMLDLSEAPDAYKNIDQVMENQKDLVKILVKLKPLGVVKG